MSTNLTQTTAPWRIRREDYNECGSVIDSRNNGVVLNGETTDSIDTLKGRSAMELGFLEDRDEFPLGGDYYTTIYWLETQTPGSEDWTLLCSIEPAHQSPTADLTDEEFDLMIGAIEP